MYRKILRFVVLCLLVLVSSVCVANNFTDGGSDHLWKTAGNWSDAAAPGASDSAKMNVDGTICVVDSTHVGGVAAVCTGLYIGAGVENELHVSGGSLTITDAINVGRGDADSGADAYFKMTGGTVTAQDIKIPNQFSNGTGNIVGHVDLWGGTITVTRNFIMGNRVSGSADGGTGTMDVEGGTLIVDGDSETDIQGYIDAGWITSYGGTGSFELDYNGRNSDKTTLTAVNLAVAPSAAEIIEPENGQTDVLETATLRWVAGFAATSHDVYFGTVNPPPFIDNRSGTSYDPGPLAAGTTYYWRIDEKNSYGTTTGAIWSFTTFEPQEGDVNGDGVVDIHDLMEFINHWLEDECFDPNWCGGADLSRSTNVDLVDYAMLVSNIEIEDVQPASNPSPASGTTGVSVYADLNWSASSGAGSYNVYFGTSNPPALQGNQSSTSFDPGALDSNTEYFWRVDAKGFFGAVTGPAWSFTTETVIPETGASHPDPADGQQYVSTSRMLNWFPGIGADSHDVYFGTSETAVSDATPASAEHKGNQTATTYDPGTLNTNWTTYYWRVDEHVDGDVIKGRVWEFSTAPGAGPPYVDYCKMLEHDIANRKHGFLAGNTINYIGGNYGHWRRNEDETIGFTHPIFHDGRSEGYAMCDDPYWGYGASEQGAAYHKDTKVAYGTVIINGTEYEHPAPKKLYWRPDKMVCEYTVGGVNITEEKFITDNDVLCSIITSDQPISIKFEGHNYWNDTFSMSSTATCAHDDANDALNISEGGTILATPYLDIEKSEWPIMFTGMHTILAANRNLTNYSCTADADNVQNYEFRVACDSDGVELMWAMDDDYAVGLARIDEVRGNAEKKKLDKTKHMNTELNYQIPYFRCSDEQVNEIYYYLYALHIMYYRDVSSAGGWLDHPHVQTAVNNFMGPHRHDYEIQTKVGNWMVDKDYYAYGNYRIWKNQSGYNDGTGKAHGWYGNSWVGGSCNGMSWISPNVWHAYEHSGDMDFLSDMYDNMLEDFYYAGSINAARGSQYEAAGSLDKIATELNATTSSTYYQDWLVNGGVDQDFFDNGWEDNGWEYMFMANDDGPETLTNGWMNYLRNDYPGYEGGFPDLWAAQIYDYWGVDPVNGFFWVVPMSKFLIPYIGYADNDHFVSTPDAAYFRQVGMFKNHIGLNAVDICLTHIKTYNWQEEWGVPIAPETIGVDDGYPMIPLDAGDQYSNFNAGKLILILEGLCGLDYSVPDSTFTISDTMPTEWSYMNIKVPIGDNDQADWVDVRVDRSTVEGNTVKTYSVKDCPLDDVKISAFLEEREIVSATNTDYTTDDEHYHGYALYSPLAGSSDPSLTLTLSDTSGPWPYTSLWKKAPTTKNSSAIQMQAEWSIDKDGVEYYFECTTDSQFNSGWQDSEKYTANGLNSNTTYAFRVKTRDKSAGNYETNYSETKSATTN